MEQLKAFLEKINTDNEIKAKLEALGEKAKEPDVFIPIAAEYGFKVTEEDIQAFAKNVLEHSEALNEDELETVAGGMQIGAKPHHSILPEPPKFLW